MTAEEAYKITLSNKERLIQDTLTNVLFKIKNTALEGKSGIYITSKEDNKLYYDFLTYKTILYEHLNNLGYNCNDSLNKGRIIISWKPKEKESNEL